ncbi:HI0933 family protein [Parvibaculum lavamentivorans DS-1]|uniref:HI0933 family protein n=1 Tax=Parvibaculum lavamentivorans (strain DS-1 / DSM 13023 / NCIMB 13966) TaxID=402881 RepID=A7HTA6_PARL1|nr:TIGR03862 family flavoprotein [Parvibaculum lavamentivorans]ABS63139.1 HI0933 family protein [Parvibaculum lavamentivorans DS-1]
MNASPEKIDGAKPLAAIIGGGPAGLMAAEMLSEQAEVHVFDAMPSLARKFLLAGKSGLNITHGEEFASFINRFGDAREKLRTALEAFTPQDVRDWAAGLGIETFEGSSHRIFPRQMKASPLLRAWIQRLGRAGVTFHTKHKWRGWTDDGALVFETPDGERLFTPAATVLALGGASWPRLGSDGGWTRLLAEKGIRINELKPANCGFEVSWSEHLKTRFAGHPVKSVALEFGGTRIKGDFVVTETGVEGSAVYALSGPLRDEIASNGKALLKIDLAPDRDEARLVRELERPQGKSSMANFLRKVAGIEGVKAALLREAGPDLPWDPTQLMKRIKHLELVLTAPRPIAEAISSAGGIALDDLGTDYMTSVPGLFAAGEMLDWEAPTGGYLLTACLATGRAAGLGAGEFLARTR